MGLVKIPNESLVFYKNNFEKIIEEGSLAEGDFNTKLSDFVASYTDAKYALNFCSNGAGILSSLIVLKRYYDCHSVFIQANTMYGVKTMAKSSGLNYLGEVDSSLSTLMPTYEQVVAFVNNNKVEKNSVFLLTHIGGIINPDIEKIAEYLKGKEIYLLEDCAHSFGATLKGKHSGLYGIAGVYSLYATKSIPAGEGGLFVSNDLEFYNYLSKFLIYDRFDQTMDVGVNFRISELQALFSYSVCKEISSIIENKRAIANQYKKICDEKGINYIIQDSTISAGNYYKFIVLSNEAYNVKRLETVTSPVYDYSLGKDVENIVSKHACLPTWYDLDSIVVEKACDELMAL